MKRRKIRTIQDVNALPVSPRVPRLPNYETISQQIARETREEEAKRQEQLTAPLRQAQAELHAETREISRRVKAFYSQNLAEMGAFPLNSVPVDTVSILAGNFPTRHTPRDHSEEGDIYREFRKGIEAQCISLSEDGFRRLGSWVSVQVAKGDIVPSTELWQCGLDRLTALACFRPGESNYVARAPAPQPAAQPQPEPSVDRLRTDDKKWLETVNQGWTQDFKKWFGAWKSSLKANFDYDFPEKLGQKAAEYLTRWNLSPFRYESWDKVRVAFVKLGYFRSDMLTPTEHLSELVESAEMSNRDVRRDFALRTREILASGPPIPRHK